jgi:hypothetical protein
VELVDYAHHEDGINLVQHLRIVELEDPALLAQRILIKDTQVEGLLGVRPAPALGLECGAFRSRLLVEVVSVEN